MPCCPFSKTKFVHVRGFGEFCVMDVMGCVVALAKTKRDILDLFFLLCHITAWGQGGVYFFPSLREGQGMASRHRESVSCR